ncbi:MAG: hypothetical protein ACRCXZ_04450 [Patescibacteria group bacterium]
MIQPGQPERIISKTQESIKRILSIVSISSLAKKESSAISSKETYLDFVSFRSKVKAQIEELRAIFSKEKSISESSPTPDKLINQSFDQFFESIDPEGFQEIKKLRKIDLVLQAAENQSMQDATEATHVYSDIIQSISQEADSIFHSCHRKIESASKGFDNPIESAIATTLKITIEQAKAFLDNSELKLTEDQIIAIADYLYQQENKYQIEKIKILRDPNAELSFDSAPCPNEIYYQPRRIFIQMISEQVNIKARKIQQDLQIAFHSAHDEMEFSSRSGTVEFELEDTESARNLNRIEQNPSIQNYSQIFRAKATYALISVLAYCNNFRIKN